MNLIAFQLDVAFDQSTSLNQRLVAKAQLHTGLSYFRSVSNRWKNAKWASRVMEWAISKVNTDLELSSIRRTRLHTPVSDGGALSPSRIDPLSGRGNAAVDGGHANTTSQPKNGDIAFNGTRGVGGIDYLNGMGPLMNLDLGDGVDLMDGLLPDSLLQGFLDSNMFDMDYRIPGGLAI